MQSQGEHGIIEDYTEKSSVTLIRHDACSSNWDACAQIKGKLHLQPLFSRRQQANYYPQMSDTLELLYRRAFNSEIMMAILLAFTLGSRCNWADSGAREGDEGIGAYHIPP